MMTTFELVRAKAEAAHKAACALGVVSAAVKNKALLTMADALLAKQILLLKPMTGICRLPEKTA